MFWTIAATVVATGVAFVLAMNFVIPEKRLERQIEHRYSAADPQFKREMGVLMGPAVLSGNRVVALQNGDEIFPAMLEAIKSAKKTITFEIYIYWKGEIGTLQEPAHLADINHGGDAG